MQDIVVKIADFGVARPINDVGPSLNVTKVSILGKLSSRNVEHELFGAPELSTEDYDYKVDLYSAGVVLYILCCYLRHRQHREWQVEIEQFRAGSLNITHLCHGDETLVQLLRDLLSKKPSVRPSAQAAVERYSRTADFRNMYTTPLKSSVAFLAKGDISALRAEWFRAHGIKEAAGKTMFYRQNLFCQQRERKKKLGLPGNFGVGVGVT